MDSEQPSSTDIEYGDWRRVSRREAFQEAMDAAIPFARWTGLIEPHCYADGPGKRGRKAKPVETMLPGSERGRDVVHAVRRSASGSAGR